MLEMLDQITPKFSPEIQSKLPYIYLQGSMHHFTLKVAYNMEIVKILKPTKICGGNAGSDHMQI